MAGDVALQPVVELPLGLGERLQGGSGGIDGQYRTDPST